MIFIYSSFVTLKYFLIILSVVLGVKVELYYDTLLSIKFIRFNIKYIFYNFFKELKLGYPNFSVGTQTK